ncbi:hypothetical protein [Myxosarcina sp. GI1]|uniref:hypothetical protein n=1 Tax=Myxosarcina sp. GI1 TaxID=1541065 RepID=UPI00055B458D|nr:hypothetical protein [Myxosarcina sp. GI1]
MEHGIVHKLTPEQEELEKKKLELATLETELAEKELNLATFQAELNAFEQEYMRVIGVRYKELERIKAQINKYMALIEKFPIVGKFRRQPFSCLNPTS